MAYVPVPKDLNKIKTKLALNLTKRQLICFSLAAAAGIPLTGRHDPPLQSVKRFLRKVMIPSSCILPSSSESTLRFTHR